MKKKQLVDFKEKVFNFMLENWLLHLILLAIGGFFLGTYFLDSTAEDKFIGTYLGAVAVVILGFFAETWRADRRLLWAKKEERLDIARNPNSPKKHFKILSQRCRPIGAYRSCKE